MGISAGLSTTVPDPVGNDGTGEGAIMSMQGEEYSSFSFYLEKLIADISFYWHVILFWPILIAEFIGGIYNDELIVSMSVDLLGTFQVSSFSYETTLDDSLSESELVALQVDMPDPIEDLGGPLGIFASVLAGYWVVIDLAVSFSIVNPTSWTIVGLVTLFIVLWLSWLWAIDSGVASGAVTLGEARSLTLGFAFGLFLETVIFAALCATAVTLVKRSYESANTFFQKMKEVAEDWGIISFAIKAIVLIITMIMYGKYYNMAVQDYLSQT